MAALAGRTRACAGFAHAGEHLGARRAPCGHHHVTAGRSAGAAPDRLATHGDGFGHFSGLRHKALDDLDCNFLFGEAFNRLHEPFFVQAHQVDGSAVGARAARAADAVHVVFRDVGDVVIHHVWQVVNVDAARGDICRYQRTYVAALEATQGLRSGRLALVAMQRHGVNAVFRQKLGDVVGAKFGAREDQHLAPVLLVDDVCQQGLLFAAPDRVDHLGDALHRGVARCHLHALRVLQQRGGQITNLVAEGG